MNGPKPPPGAGLSAGEKSQRDVAQKQPDGAGETAAVHSFSARAVDAAVAAGPGGSRAWYGQNLPEWLAAQLERYQHLQQGQWRPARLEQQIARFWEGHLRLWRWLLARHPNVTLDQLRRARICSITWTRS